MPTLWAHWRQCQDAPETKFECGRRSRYRHHRAGPGQPTCTGPSGAARAGPEGPVPVPPSGPGRAGGTGVDSYGRRKHGDGLFVGSGSRCLPICSWLGPAQGEMLQLRSSSSTATSMDEACASLSCRLGSFQCLKFQFGIRYSAFGFPQPRASF